MFRPRWEAGTSVAVASGRSGGASAEPADKSISSMRKTGPKAGGSLQAAAPSNVALVFVLALCGKFVPLVRSWSGGQSARSPQQFRTSK